MSLETVAGQSRRAEGFGTASETRRWFALRTRSRHERILAAELIRAGTEAWTPTVERDERYGDYGVTVWQPLFPGYVFLQGDQADVERALATGRVLEVVAMTDVEDVGMAAAGLQRNR